MDKEKFLSRISAAQKRAGGKIPSAEFSEEDVVSKPAIVGTPLEAFKRNFKANRGTLFESIDDLVKFLHAQGYKRNYPNWLKSLRCLSLSIGRILTRRNLA